MLHTRLTEKFMNVNRKSEFGKFSATPEAFQVDYKEYNYHLKKENGKSTVLQEIAPLNDKKLDSLIISRALKSLSFDNPTGEFDYSLKNDSINVAKCGQPRSLHVNNSEEQIHVGGYYCRKRFCPMCTYRESKRKAFEMERVITELFDRCKDQTHAPRLGFVTLTVPNCTLEDLSYTVTKMMNAWKRLMLDRGFQKAIVGGYRTLEVTYNADDDTFHPHFHLLLVGKQRANLREWFTMSGFAQRRKADKNYVAEKHWRELWQKSLHQVGHYVDISYKSLDVQHINSPKKMNVEDPIERKIMIADACKEFAKYVWKYGDLTSLAKPTYQNTKYDTGLYKDGTRFKPARGKVGAKKPKHVQDEDFDKMKKALYWMMRGLHLRNCHRYWGVLYDISKELKENTTDIKNSIDMNYHNPVDIRPRLVRYYGDVLIGQDGQQVYNENESVQKFSVKDVMAIKFYKQKPNENGERDVFYQIVEEKIWGKNSLGQEEMILHNIHYATNIFIK